MGSLLGPYGIPAEEFLRYVLIFLRIGGVLFTVPIFGDSSTPLRIRILLAGALTVGLHPLIAPTWLVSMPQDVVAILLCVCKELLIGVVLGFAAKATFEGVLMAANLVGFQMGFGTGNMFLAESDGQINSFAALHKSIVILFFLGLSLHHIFIQALTESFTLIPAGLATTHAGMFKILIATSADVFLLALQLAAPILIALLFSMATLGLLARAVPQLNVFVLSFQASFYVGLLVYIATIPFFPNWMKDQFMHQGTALTTILKTLKPA